MNVPHRQQLARNSFAVEENNMNGCYTGGPPGWFPRTSTLRKALKERIEAKRRAQGAPNVKDKAQK